MIFGDSCLLHPPLQKDILKNTKFILIVTVLASFSPLIRFQLSPQIIIPQKQVGRNSDIYVTMVSYTTQVSLAKLQLS